MTVDLQQFRDRTVEHKFGIQFGATYWSYIIGGGKGAVAFNIWKYGENQYSSGLEFHHRAMPTDRGDVAPSHPDCIYTGGPCWHDGASLYAEEELLPIWKGRKDNPLMVLRMVLSEYESRFNSGNEPD